MYDCSACMLRCLRAVLSESIPASRLLLRRPRSLYARSTSRRSASSATAAAVAPNGTKYLNAAQIRHHTAKENVEVEDTVQGGIAASEARALKRELQWLPDPLKLAEHVHYTLRCDQPEKALALCREASKSMKCIVSWNHVITWHMQRNSTQEALKIYNEMKKRAQFPDSYTYMALLSGLAGQQNHHRKPEFKHDNATKAVNIYNSMSSPTSRVKPSILHTNAVLRVCSFAFDLDAFWGVVGKLPEKGPNSADHITYTIIFTALRHGAVSKEIAASSLKERDTKRFKAVNEARRIWADVVTKWRAGEVQIDEELVGAVGRVLLLSPSMHDWDDVLNLVHQTMQIERLVPAIGSPERETGHVPQLPSPAEQDVMTESEQEDRDGYVDTPAAKSFRPVQPLPKDPTQPRRTTTLAYATPGNDVLSVLIEACSNMRTPKTAIAYWETLTTRFGLKPDLANFHTLLHLLSKNRASGRVAAVLRDDMQKVGVVPKNMTFTLAMGTCMRDKKNLGALDHAATIVNVMLAKQEYPDIKVLVSYLKLALMSDNGPKIAETLNRLDAAVHVLRSRVTYGVEDPRSQTEDLLDKEETVRFLQMMVGTIDTLMNRGLVPREEFSHWHARRSQLNAFISRAKTRLEKQRFTMGRDPSLFVKEKRLISQSGRTGGQTRQQTSVTDQPPADHILSPRGYQGQPGLVGTGGSGELSAFRRRGSAAQRAAEPRGRFGEVSSTPRGRRNENVGWGLSSGSGSRQGPAGREGLGWQNGVSARNEKFEGEGARFADSPLELGM